VARTVSYAMTDALTTTAVRWRGAAVPPPLVPSLLGEARVQRDDDGSQGSLSFSSMQPSRSTGLLSPSPPRAETPQVSDHSLPPLLCVRLSRVPSATFLFLLCAAAIAAEMHV
jgi:hypothetical protein